MDVKVFMQHLFYLASSMPPLNIAFPDVSSNIRKVAVKDDAIPFGVCACKHLVLGDAVDCIRYKKLYSA